VLSWQWAQVIKVGMVAEATALSYSSVAIILISTVSVVAPQPRFWCCTNCSGKSLGRALFNLDSGQESAI
jgi:hypothetical protein